MVVPQTAPTSNIEIAAGLGFIVDATTNGTPSAINMIGGVNDKNPLKPLVLTRNEIVAIDPQPSAGNYRIDIIEVRYDRQLSEPSLRSVFDEIIADSVPKTVNKNLGFTINSSVGRVVTPTASTAPISYKRGAEAPAGTEVAPPTTNGYVKIAEIRVRDAAANPMNTYDMDMISDTRTVRSLEPEMTIRMRIVMPCAGVSVKPTIVEYIGPAGIRVGAYGVSVTGAEMFIVIAAGGEVRAMTALASCEMVDLPLTNFYIPQFIVNKNAGALSSVVRGLLLGAGSAYPMKVSANQMVSVIGLKTVQQVAGATQAPAGVAGPLPPPSIYNIHIAINQ
jgi:hypothetical protein